MPSNPGKRAVMNDDRRQKGQWTARAALRLTGAVVLLIVALMAVLGGFVFDLAASAGLFLIYWTIFALLLLVAIMIAMFDAVATIGRFKREHAQLHDKFTQEFQEESYTENKEENETEDQGKP